MIAAIAIGIGFLIVVSIVVGIVDASRAPAWRQVARERRQLWEARQMQYHGAENGNDEWDSEDDD